MKKNELLSCVKKYRMEAKIYYHGLDANGDKMYRVELDKESMDKYKKLDNIDKIGRRANYNKNYVLTSRVFYETFAYELMEKIYCGNWENLGDTNPLEYSGLWVKKDISEGCYNVVVLENDNINYHIHDLYVDVNASWINWNNVKNYSGTENYSGDYMKVVDLLRYYSSEFVCNYDSFKMNKNIARKKLKEFGIHISR